MKRRPAVVAFDVIETLFSLESLRPRLVALGLEGHLLETWFAQLLRDAFALDATGIYKPFREVATATLLSLSGANAAIDAGRIDAVIDAFATLDAQSDATPAMKKLRGAGIRIFALTNGNADTTRKLLERNELQPFVERVVSIDEVRRWKPQREVYLHCAASAGVDPGNLALIAAHGWDIHGANRAGLVTGYVSRDRKPFPATMDRPDVVGSTLVEVAGKLIDSD